MQLRKKWFVVIGIMMTVLTLLLFTMGVHVEDYLYQAAISNWTRRNKEDKALPEKILTSYDTERSKLFKDVMPLLAETKVEVYPNWTTQDPKDSSFIRRVYLYSAIIDIYQSSFSRTDVHFPAFQDGRFFSPLTCCAKLPGKPQYRGDIMEVDFARTKILPDKALSRDLSFIGAVYRCHFPFTAKELRGAHVTLATMSCPVNVGEYLVVQEPVQKPQGLGVCAKVAFGHHLDPYKLLEWIETQKLLGVDTIELFECNNTELVYNIFRHYQESGLLSLLPFKLPGRPWGRNFLAGNNDWTRWNDETELPIWDCRLRLAGHQYVMDLDMDEIIMPKKLTRLKPLFQELFKNPKVSAVHFRPQFFIEDWGPVNREAPLLLLQYLNSTEPMYTGKETYVPSRTHQAITHTSIPYKGYKRNVADPAVAVLHHYRKWKSLWHWKPNNTFVDHNIERLQEELVPAVKAVRDKMGMKQQG